MTDQHPEPKGYYLLRENHPIVSLILLLVLVTAGYLIFGALSIFLAFYLTDLKSTDEIMLMLEGEGGNASALKILQAGTSIGMFIIPALMLGVMERHRTTYLRHTVPVNPTLWFIVLAVMFFSTPILEQSIKLNEAMRLPEALAGLESWMKTQELKLEKLTRFFLADTSYWDLLINLIVLAVIPAIGEEFVFRGCLQNILGRWFGNPHAAVWAAAIIFSAIHLQFYGFLPRLLLGALFGYLLLWGKNIWLPVFAHFLNNAAVTASAFYVQRQGKALEEINFGDKIPMYLYIVSILITMVLIYQYRKTALTGKT